MNLAHLFEAGMLVCFGFSWPLNVVKAYKSGTAKGTSLAFIILIITGYVAGITAKVINGQFNYVLAVYILNLAIVMTNVLVYIRNKSLDRKGGRNKELKVSVEDIKAKAQEDVMVNYSNYLDEVINKNDDYVEKQNGVILVGGSLDKQIPVAALGKEFDFNFEIYNKSVDGLSVGNAADYLKNQVFPLFPEGIMLHLGDQDVNLFKNDAAAFDNYYLNLLFMIKNENPKCRIALISVSNPENDKTLSLLNSHIKVIAQSENVSYINLEGAKLWNPKATKAASDFAYSMGLRIRKPLADVAEILYSYAFHNLETRNAESLVG